MEQSNQTRLNKRLNLVNLCQTFLLNIDKQRIKKSIIDKKNPEL